MAAEEKQAKDIKVLDLREITSFADYFILCTGLNNRQNQAICNEIDNHLKTLGERPNSIEGYDNAEWILMDYGDYLVHIFSE
ncbi:MAG: ribosome silencing factor, partial [Acidobacteriota bacterium]